MKSQGQANIGSMIIEQVNRSSPFLQKVKDLGRKNSTTLGFFPKGAFNEYANKGGILIARSKEGEFYGYLLYRVSHRGGGLPVAVIVHLCVDSSFRNKGVARELIGELRKITQDGFLRLEVNCRRDYEANGLWHKFDFVCTGETPGRGRRRQPVSKWELELRPLPLLAFLKQKEADKNIRAVLDACVLYRLQDDIPKEGVIEKLLSEEAKALLGDWLGRDIILFITKETFNEINRHADEIKRKQRRNYAHSYDKLETDLNSVKELRRRLAPFFPVNPNENIKSDISQIANAIAGKAHFFITQDIGLLKRNTIIHSNFGIRILRPGNFISRIDEVIREEEYRPILLGGSGDFQINKIRGDQIPDLYQLFHRTNSKEKKSHFDVKVHHFKAHPHRYDFELCVQKGIGVLALIVSDREDYSEISIPLIRVSPSPLSGTVLRHLLRRVILTSVRENRPFVRITDTQGQVGFEKPLEECGFTNIDGQWVKCSLQVAVKSTFLVGQLNSLKQQFSTIPPLLDNLIKELSYAMERQDALLWADFERRVWPAKVLDADIRSYIISIEPIWAKDLFDQTIAKEILWGSKDDLLLRNENVYYRSKHSFWKIVSPARILWYVLPSQKHLTSSKQIRACSSLDEVIIGPPKKLFKRFERLGVYKWPDVLRTANNNINNDIMALRFSNTELLPYPIKLSVLRNIITEEEHKQPSLQSPQRILPNTFARIYQATFNDDKGLS
ncbi:MAG: GNAT family N-acetyltransferase [Desulfobaccales bacterium]